MKATLKFKLPKERYEYLAAARASELLSVLHDIENVCRRVVKVDSTSAEIRLAQEIRELVWQELGMHQ